MRLLPLLSLCVTIPAAAVQVDYTLNFGLGTLNGNPLTSIAILESGPGGQVSVDFPFTVPGSGIQTLSHNVAFQPTTSLIVGLDLPSTTGGDIKTHVLFFANQNFVNGASGALFSVAFPNTRHNAFITHLLAAEAGDATELAWLTSFFLTGDGAAAAFATGTQPAGIEFTVGVPLVPEPLTYSLTAAGLLAMLVLRRKR